MVIRHINALLTARKTNHEMLNQTKQQRELLITIKIRQLKFFGHITRKQMLEFIVTCGKIKKRYQQKEKKIDNRLKGFLNVKSETIFERARNRNNWKINIAWWQPKPNPSIVPDDDFIISVN